MPVGHETGQQPQSRGGTGRLDVHEDIGRGHRLPHVRGEAGGMVEIVDLQHGVDEVDQRMLGQLVESSGGAVLGEVARAAVQTEAIVTEADRLRPMHGGFAHHDLDVDAGPLLTGASDRGDDLHRHPGMPTLDIGGRRGGDIGAESIGRRDPHNPLQRAGLARRSAERAHRRLHRLGGGQYLAAAIGEFPSGADPRQHPGPDGLLEGGDAPRDGGVIDPERLRGGHVAAGAPDGQQDQQIVRARQAHICIFADMSCRSDHCFDLDVHEYSPVCVLPITIPPPPPD